MNTDEYFLHFIKYEFCIYILGGIGALSQIVAFLVVFGHLLIGVEEYIKDPTLAYYAFVSSIIGITLLNASTISEIALMRAVKQRKLPYIRWWLFSSVVFLLFSALMTVIVGFSLGDEALWITLSFLYMVIRLPFQMHFVDMFTQVEIMQKYVPSSAYTGVLYSRFR